jgi:hypothetical protein
MLNNLRYVLRALAKNRALIAIAASLLAIGIDGNAVVRVNRAALRHAEMQSFEVLGKVLRHVVPDGSTPKCAFTALVRKSGVSALFAEYQTSFRHLIYKWPPCRNRAFIPASNQRSAIHALEIHRARALYPRVDYPARLAVQPQLDLLPSDLLLLSRGPCASGQRVRPPRQQHLAFRGPETAPRLMLFCS